MRGEVLMHPIRKDDPVMIDNIDSPYASIASLRNLIYRRGLPSAPVPVETVRVS